MSILNAGNALTDRYMWVYSIHIWFVFGVYVYYIARNILGSAWWSNMIWQSEEAKKTKTLYQPWFCSFIWKLNHESEKEEKMENMIIEFLEDFGGCFVPVWGFKRLFLSEWSISWLCLLQSPYRFYTFKVNSCFLIHQQNGKKQFQQTHPVCPWENGRVKVATTPRLTCLT